MENKKTESLPSQAKGYWIVLATVSDLHQFNQYSVKAAPIIANYDGKVIIRGDAAIMVEGTLPGKPFVIEFPNYTAAQACFNSKEYQEAILLRKEAAQFQIVIVEGTASVI